MTQYSEETPRHAKQYTPEFAKSTFVVIGLYFVAAIAAVLIFLEPR